MNEVEFIARWNSDRGMYEVWGNHVVACIVEGLRSQIPAPACDLFLRIPPKPRVKSDASFLAKAFTRKSYKDPYTDITDKVGVRFVVLLGRDIKLLSEIIENSVLWNFSRDRDYQIEQEAKPIQFEYAAVHYVVRCRSEIKVDGHLVPCDTPCEIQVKTILQHAYSELTHDTIYKPSASISPAIEREAAKSMALLEATGDYFDRIVSRIEETVETAKTLSTLLEKVYRAKVGHNAEVTRLEGLIIDAFEGNAGENVSDRIEELLSTKPFIIDRIKGRIKTSVLFRQPSILFIYLMAQEAPDLAKEQWPLTPEELRPVFIDLGIAFDSV